MTCGGSGTTTTLTETCHITSETHTGNTWVWTVEARLSAPGTVHPDQTSIFDIA